MWATAAPNREDRGHLSEERNAALQNGSRKHCVVLVNTFIHSVVFEDFMACV